MKGDPLLFLTICRLVISLWPSLSWGWGDDGECRWLALGWLELAWTRKEDS